MKEFKNKSQNIKECEWMTNLFVPLGDSLAAGGPSTNVGGERKGLVSDPGRPRGDGPYNGLSARNKPGKA